jgi:hypothetical protein
MLLTGISFICKDVMHAQAGLCTGCSHSAIHATPKDYNFQHPPAGAPPEGGPMGMGRGGPPKPPAGLGPPDAGPPMPAAGGGGPPIPPWRHNTATGAALVIVLGLCCAYIKPALQSGGMISTAWSLGSRFVCTAEVWACIAN